MIIEAGVSAWGRVRRGLAAAINLAEPGSADAGAGPGPAEAARHGDRRVHAGSVARILAAADERDAISDALDATAAERERERDLAEMLAVDGEYGDHWAERRQAGLDRLRAKEDRAAARRDRLALARITPDETPSDHV